MKLTISIIAILALGFTIPNEVSFSKENKIAAFEVLDQKCNSCHLTDLPKKVFTFENMDNFANKIYKQVFIKKKMPKGKEVVLTPEELGVLQDWLIEELQITINPE